MSMQQQVKGGCVYNAVYGSLETECTQLGIGMYLNRCASCKLELEIHPRGKSLRQKQQTNPSNLISTAGRNSLMNLTSSSVLVCPVPSWEDPFLGA
jgi:hypothetical protein